MGSFPNVHIALWDTQNRCVVFENHLTHSTSTSCNGWQLICGWADAENVHSGSMFFVLWCTLFEYYLTRLSKPKLTITCCYALESLCLFAMGRCALLIGAYYCWFLLPEFPFSIALRPISTCVVNLVLGFPDVSWRNHLDCWYAYVKLPLLKVYIVQWESPNLGRPCANSVTKCVRDCP